MIADSVWAICVGSFLFPAVADSRPFSGDTLYWSSALDFYFFQTTPISRLQQQQQEPAELLTSTNTPLSVCVPAATYLCAAQRMAEIFRWGETIWTKRKYSSSVTQDSSPLCSQSMRKSGCKPGIGYRDQCPVLGISFLQSEPLSFCANQSFKLQLGGELEGGSLVPVSHLLYR